ncbi:MAG: hypothetical protein ACI4PR_04480 [Acutalibacteraceae bacterium]
MKSRKELMNSFIKEDGERIFELFYSLMIGGIDLKSLNEKEKIIAECIKNECTDENGVCYELYRSLRKIRNSKTKMQVIELYESILKSMCRQMFFNALKLGIVLKISNEKLIGKNYDYINI